ncbi:hypothetical protein [Devosia sp. 1635]|uniref:hypothetical protein n=1 Tax=Devosia sp. 1635 TaxID=2726066 RepID=UPI0015633083|nr:hypothetical protein [Devosia sp. 1635]
MKLSAIKTDLAKAEQGVWIDNIPDMGELRLKVRPVGNPDYRRVYGQLVDATPRHLKRGGIISDQQTKSDISARTLADTVLLDWDGLEGEDGKPLKYDPVLAKQLLLNPEYGALRDAVAWAGNVASEETTGTAEANAGN